MIKVAFITTGFSKDEQDYGGASSIHNFIKELSLSGKVDVTVFALYYPPKNNGYKFYNAKIFSFGKDIPQARLEKYSIWKDCQKKFTEEHSLKKFDIIHSLWSGESGYIGSKLSIKFNIPMLTTVCGGELASIKEINYGSQLKFWQKHFVEKSFDQSKVIISLSGYITDKINNTYNGKYSDKIRTIPFGVDSKLFSPQNKPSSKKIINIANAVPVKSHIDLFKAFKIVLQKFPDYTLKCYGRDDNSYLKQLAEKLEITNKVHLHGFVDYEKIPAEFNNADCFVLSSLYEAQNTSIIEAAMCGLPVVSTNVGCAPDVTNHLVNPRDYNTLAEKTNSVIDNLAEEKNKALSAIFSLKEKYSLQNNTNKTLTLYKTILTGKRT